MTPVKCTYCGSIYNLGEGHVICRYADCTTFITPCCGREADDREWVSRPSFVRLDSDRYINYTDGTSMWSAVAAAYARRSANDGK